MIFLNNYVGYLLHHHSECDYFTINVEEKEKQDIQFKN